MVATRRRTLNRSEAEKYSFCSLPSLILFAAALPKPPSVTRLKTLKYAVNRKYAPSNDGPRKWAK